MSSVGKHTARESEAPNVVRMGKSAWRAPTPEFGPDPARGPGDLPLGRVWVAAVWFGGSVGGAAIGMAKTAA
jgi:hypothetical protein